jgi:pimeloyl-ACP methyl ester carboxylesterase
MTMLRVPVDGISLEYEVRGTGEPVVFIHGGAVAGTFSPMLDEPSVAGYRLIRYHRVGYAGSERVAGPVTVAQQAAHCRALLRHLDAEPAHVVGNSSGANIALQLALDHPSAVRSLALLETALLAVPTGPFAGEAMRHFHAGDAASAVDIWMRGVAGAGYRAVLDRVLPGAFEQAVRDAYTFFGQELPAVREWSFGPDEAARIAQPVLAVLGGRSDEVSPVFGQRHDLLMAWLPNARPFVLAGATHLMQVQDPAGVADGLARHLGQS